MYINCCWYNTKENIIYSMEKANKSANIRSVYRICIWNIFRSFDAWPPDHWFNARSIVKNVEVPRPSNNGITALNINVSVDLGYDGSNGFLLIHLFYTWKLNALFCTVMNFQKKNVNFNCNFSPWLIFHCDQRDEKMTKNHLRTIVQSVCNTVSVWYYQISWMHIFTCFELPLFLLKCQNARSLKFFFSWSYFECIFWTVYVIESWYYMHIRNCTKKTPGIFFPK